MKKTAYKAIKNVKIKLNSILELIAEDKDINKLRDFCDEAKNDFCNKSHEWQNSENGIEEGLRIQYFYDFISEIKYIRENLRNSINKIEKIENDAPEGSFN